MADDKLEFSISEKGVSAKSEGEGAHSIVGALVDFASPFTEGMGALGDMLRAYRVPRVLRTIASAKQLAKELDVELQPVPPKFLVNWVEGASLEDDADGDELSEMWAGLLVSAAQGIKPGHHLYRRLLSELAPEHARLLSDLFGDHSPDEFSDQFKIAQDRIHEYFAETPQAWNPDRISFEAVAAEMVDLAGPGVAIASFRFDVTTDLGLKRVKSLFGGSFENLNPYFQNHVVEMLRTTGLIRTTSYNCTVESDEYFQNQGTGIWDNEHRRGLLRVEVLNLTPMGQDFMISCLGK